MIRPGDPGRPGAWRDGEGVNFALFSERAEAVELCLFDGQGRETARHRLPAHDVGTWHGFLPGCPAGQRYGYRVHGQYAPEHGLRFNPHKLLIDPYARALDGSFTWHPAVFDFDPAGQANEWRRNETDSAPFVPKSAVTGDEPPPSWRRPRAPWSDTVIYEANVRGYTMRHPAVPEVDRGTFRGMANGAILDYLKALGVTAIELMPVHAFIDEAFLEPRGLRNYWGYNTINFFAAAGRYAGERPAAEFREMVNAIHDAGMEVILDVAYNHTGESDERGPTLSFRGIDNLAYYRTARGEPGGYVNDTGCGNTLNADHPAAQSLVLDSLRYWHADMGVDGFRFDIATVLGRTAEGFNGDHPLLRRIGQDRALQGVKLIAEPWDVGPGGYQLGRFPPPWAAWNDRFRDSARRFWRGDPGAAGEFARRLHGSSDLFEPAGHSPFASINFVTAHDGFTLSDLVSYGEKHNAANGEQNRDGHDPNYSANHGAEGPSSDAEITALRRRQRLNLLATLLVSQGTPMLLAGDEFGNTQAGNNNAYCQDNELGWVDWSGLATDPGFTELVRDLVRLRRGTSLLRQACYRHGEANLPNGWRNIEWFRVDGARIQPGDWDSTQAFAMYLRAGDSAAGSFAVAFNASASAVEFHLPASLSPDGWKIAFHSHAADLETHPSGQGLILPEHTLACLRAKA